MKCKNIIFIEEFKDKIKKVTFIFLMGALLFNYLNKTKVGHVNRFM